MKFKNFILFNLKLLKFLLILNLINSSLSQNAKEKSLSNSISGMVHLLDIEMHLIESLEKYANELQAKVNTLNKLVHDLKEENEKSLNDREAYLYIPLNGFSLIRRMYNDWPHIELFMTRPVGKDYLKVISSYRLQMPTATDLEEASRAIERIQTVYDLKASDLIRGIIYGKQYSATLKAVDSYFMGYYLYSNELYHSAGTWLNNSLNGYEEDYEFNRIIGFTKQKLLKLYAETLVEQNRPKEALSFISQASALQPFSVQLLKRKNEIQELANINKEEPLEEPQPYLTNYELGCRGEFSRQTSKMQCYYNKTASPFLKLAPVKTEIIQLEPYMALMHDVISDREIEHLKNLSIPNLVPAEVYDNENDEPFVAKYRTSKFYWFNDDHDHIIKHINQRVMDMTGLDVLGGEQLQILNYGLGGHYDQHFDFFNVSDDVTLVANRGDRIATVLFYLSDVELGGATCFPETKTVVYPRKGSAVMWYNLDNRMEVDELSLHAACPVLVGSKWIATKWIRSMAQMFRKPCYK